MKISNIVILLLTVFFIGILLTNVQMQYIGKYNTENKQYATKLSTACHDAVKAVNTADSEKVRIFDEKGQKTAVNAFYRSLAGSFGVANAPDYYDLIERTPFVILLDYDGFYINYNACFDDSGTSFVDTDSEQMNVMTPINTFSQSYGDCVARFYLYDKVDVLLSNGKLVTGSRKEVLSRIGSSTLPFLADDVSFDEERNYVVVKTLEEKMNYLLNTNLVIGPAYAMGYQINLPYSKGESFSRMISNPTVIAFHQGPTQQLGDKLMTVSAFAAGELTETHAYLVKGDTYYDSYNVAGSPSAKTLVENGTAVISYEYAGSTLDAFYPSMDDCAKNGAYPDASASNQNEVGYVY